MNKKFQVGQIWTTFDKLGPSTYSGIIALIIDFNSSNSTYTFLIDQTNDFHIVTEHKTYFIRTELIEEFLSHYTQNDLKFLLHYGSPFEVMKNNIQQRLDNLNQEVQKYSNWFNKIKQIMEQ